MLKKMFLAGVKELESKKEWINELNVFPVPDGDTGTNMTLTMMSAAKEVTAVQDLDMETLAKAISSGSLRGARGNSGVILSQLLRGFTKEIKTIEVIDQAIIAAAFKRAVETAYKAVMKPKEGTILTVAKGMADMALEAANTGLEMEEYFRVIIERGDLVLSQTPEMLPVLKQAGVVDSGGQGLMQVMKGAFDAYLGKEVDFDAAPAPAAVSSGSGAAANVEDLGEITFGYCTEFIVNLEHELEPEQVAEFKAYLESLGDSIVLVADEELVKVHVHTNDPGLAIQKGLSYGSLSRMKIDNMREEHEERLIAQASKIAAEQKAAEEEAAKDQPRKPYGFIAVSIGEGINEIFKELNVDYLISGGQTMNPSTEDMLNAIDKLNADTIYILPNNKNIILAAEQAAKMTEDKQIVVVPAKTVPQGITALINFSPEMSPEENLEVMKEEIARVKTGEVTYAVRDTSLNGFEIHEGDIMGIGDAGILADGKDIEEVTLQMIGEMVDDESCVISIYYGQDVSADKAEALESKVQALYPDLDVEVHSGGQPIYYYLVSVE
ncbi:MAG: DAK2 domain-containing protein [Lachnospiraceae bacterium]|nr:DAK2 domain-containing protein [Lachnospiraceae bacterium]